MKKALEKVLNTHELGRSHEHHDDVSSTNDRAMQWISEGAKHGSLVTATAQSEGRGRLGRVWDSPRGQGLYASLILRPESLSVSIASLGLAVGAGIRKGLLHYAQSVRGRGCKEGALDALRLKWPNDLTFQGKKMGGILCEARWNHNVPVLVVGIGVNLCRRVFPEGLTMEAIDLQSACGTEHAPEPAQVLASLLQALEDVMGRYFLGGFSAIRAEYEPFCSVLGQWISISMGSGPHAQGSRMLVKALRLDPEGALWVQAKEGREFKVEHGDVWLTEKT